jgi:hypothetical protein
MTAPKGKSLCPWFLAQPCVCRGSVRARKGSMTVPRREGSRTAADPAAPLGLLRAVWERRKSALLRPKGKVAVLLVSGSTMGCLGSVKGAEGLNDRAPPGRSPVRRGPPRPLGTPARVLGKGRTAHLGAQKERHWCRAVAGSDGLHEGAPGDGKRDLLGPLGLRSRCGKTGGTPWRVPSVSKRIVVLAGKILL